MSTTPTQLTTPAPALPFKVLIADDENLARMRLSTLLQDVAVQWPHQVVAQTESGEHTLQAVVEHTPDVLLLDIQMPDMTGLQVARHLHSLALQGQAVPAVIFVTAYDEHAIEAFEVNAFDYLTKPVRKERLLAALQRAAQLHAAQRQAQLAASQNAVQANNVRSHLPIMERGRLMLVAVADIVYLKSELKYTTVRTAQRQYITEESLVALEQEFAHLFLRIHRNALVARSAVVGFERAARMDDSGDDEHGALGAEHWEVILRDISERLTVSRRQWAVVRSLLK